MSAATDPRTTPEMVLSELGWDDRLASAVDNAITRAHIIVETRLGGHDVAEPTLVQIETLVAAQIAVVNETGELSGKIEDGFDIADASKSYNIDLLIDGAGRELGSYWKQAVALDPTGYLANPHSPSVRSSLL